MFSPKSIVFNFALWGYFYGILGVPDWAGLLIVVLLNSIVGIFVCAILEFSIIIISIAMHVYTSIFAFSHNLVNGIFTLVLPGISEIYWFIADGCEKGFNSQFCTIFLWYLLGLIIVFIMPLFCSSGIDSRV